MRMVGSCIVTTSRVITYCVVACSSSRGLPDSCIASTFFQPDACRTVRNSETDLPERFAFRKLDPTIRKEPVAMKQLPVRGSCSGPRQPSETGTRLRIPGDGDQRFPNDRDRDSWMIVISVPTEGDQ